MYKRMRRTEVKKLLQKCLVFCVRKGDFHPDFQQIPLYPRWGSWNVMLTFDFLPHDCWPQLDFFSPFQPILRGRRLRRPQLCERNNLPYPSELERKRNPFDIPRYFFSKDIFGPTGIGFAMSRLIAFYFERVAVKVFRAARGFLFYMTVKNRQKSHFLACR